MHHHTLPVVLLALAACNDQGLTTHNAEPEVTIVYPADGGSLEEAVTVTLAGQADDADDPSDELVATWTAGSRMLCETAPVASDGTTTCQVELIADDTELTLVVEDPAGATGADHITIVVQPTGSPQVELTAPLASGTYYSDRLIEFAGSVSDEEDEPTELMVGIDSSFDAEFDPVVDVASNGTISAFATLSEGEHALTLWAEDSSGKRGTDSVVIQVGPPNSDPTCSITAPESGSSVVLGASVLFEATVDDGDIPENQLGVTWTSDRDGELGSSTPTSGGEVAFSYGGLTAGTHVITMEVLDEVGGSCTDLVVLDVGSAPTIAIASPGYGDTVNEGEDLDFEASVSDNEDVATALSLSWESDLDGVFSTTGADSSGTVRFSVDDLSVGDHVITATVTDTDAMSSFASVEVSVNGAPSAPGVSLSPSAPDTRDDLTASVTTASVDPEGGSVSYSYAWYLGGGISTASTSATLPASATSRGQSWSVRVTPNDGAMDGDHGEATVSIGNAAPAVSGVTLSPSAPGVGDRITCSWSFSDADGDSDSSSVAWTVDGVAAGSGATLSSGFAEGDLVTCTVTPFDGTDSGSPGSASVTIGNSLPSVSAVSISPSAPTAADDLSCSYSFSDADGDPDHSTIAWTVGGIAAGSGATLTAGAFAKGDGVTCTVTPHDGTDAGAPVNASVVIGNQAPGLASVTLGPSGTPTTNSTITASYSASDPDGDSLTPSYTWYVDGVATSATGSTLSGVSWFDKDQAVHVEVVVVDGTDSSAPLASSAVTVANTPPDAPVVTVQPSSATEGESLGCAVVSPSNDDDVDTVTYSVTWTVGGVSYAGSTTTWSGDTVPAGVTVAGETWTCTATPHDGDDDGATASASLTVGAGNAAPSITSLLLSPTSPTTDDTISATATTYDADGDAVTVSYAWTVDGVATGTTGSTLSGVSWFDKDQVVEVTAIPSDGTDTGPAVSADVTVANTPPTSPSVTIAPSSPEAGTDDLLCSITGASIDADGDGVSYSFAWTADGASYGGAGTTTHSGDTVPASATSAGELWVCSVTPHDGDDDGATASASVTIDTGNARPSVTSLSLTPTTVYTDDTLTVTVTTRDAEGDAVTLAYAWTVDGVATGATGNTLSGVSWFDKHQDVQVTVTPSDAGGAGTPVSSSIVTVLNTPPGAPSVSISPSAPVEGVDDLICTVDVASSDDDGDSATYSVTWTVDGAAYSGASTTTWSGDTAPASATSMGEAWTCTVTPNDGDDDGTTATATTTIRSEGCPLYVDPTVPPGGDGSYGDPLPNIAYGLAYAAAGGCGEVVLMPGTYNENVDFNGQAVTVRSESGPEVTIIDPTAGLNVVTFDSGETTASVLEGVTVTGGTTHGVYISGSSPTIRDCVVTGNSGSTGAGVYASSFDGVFEDNTVSSNSSSSYGGGLYFYQGSAEIIGNWFEGNAASSGGGGIWLHATGLVAGNVLVNNTNHAIWLNASGTSSRDGSDVVNNTIAFTSDYGVYIDYYYYSSSYYFPTTRFINNVVYDSGSYDVRVAYAHSNAFYHLTWEDNNVYGGGGYSYDDQTDENGNISLDPLFVDEAGYDFSLTWGSPCIDVGQDPASHGVDQDFAGEARTMGPRTDLGAFEYAGPTDDCDGVDDGSQCATTCPVFVDPTVLPGGNGDASDPYASILYAQVYRGSCDEIALEPGTYDEPLDFEGEDLRVYSTSGAASTILNPSVGLSVVTFDSGETTASVLEGVTVTGGTTHGVYISGSSPTIRDCVVTGNSGSTGAGVYASSFDGVFEDNTVSSNSSSSYGGGLYFYQGSAEIIGNWFEGNAASSGGGGIWLHATGLVAGNVLVNNTNHAIWLNASGTSSRDGSDVVNNTIAFTSDYGVYIDYYYYSSSYYFPTTRFINNVVYDSGSYDVRVAYAHSNAFYHLTWEDNNVYGGGGYSYDDQTDENGNISLDPLFVDEAGYDFSLTWGSPCIDVGQDPASHGVDQDFAGEARTMGPRTDLGAFEYAGPTDDCDGVDDGSQCATTCPVYVDPSVMPGGDGAVSDPYASILYAQTYRGSCDEILLEAGTYAVNLDFEGEDLYIHSTSGAASTVIEPPAGLNVVTFESGETTAAILEGVTITGGTSHGVYIRNSSPTILDCIITGNSGTNGGGVYANNYDGVLDGNTISANSATYGGGLYIYSGSAEITRNRFEGNAASSGAGGGLWLHATALVASNLVLDSTNQGIHLDAAGTTSRDASDVINNTIANTSNYGVYIDYHYFSGSYYFPTTHFINNIIYNSGSNDVRVGYAHSNAFYHLTWENNDVYGGGGYSYDNQTGSNGNVSQDPNFTDAAGYDFSLAWPSAYCIDAGQDVSAYGVTTDITGRARPQGLGYDLGAYESY